jgi:hypothetical protein
MNSLHTHLLHLQRSGTPVMRSRTTECEGAVFNPRAPPCYLTPGLSFKFQF